LLALLLGVACRSPGADDVDPVDAPTDCDPLDPALCALPYPSSFFLSDADTPTGHRVRFEDATLPINRDGVRIDPRYWNEKDGFSVSASMLTWFEDVSLDGVIGHQALEAYADAGAKTVLIDTVTGERVPHFVELDASIEDESERLLVLRPVVILEYGRRYVVGIRGLNQTTGDPVAVSPAFRALRDDRPFSDLDSRRRKHFDTEVFPVLAAEGFARSELQLAWDFTTASRQNSLGRMEWIRDDLYERIGSGGPPYAVTTDTLNSCLDNGPIAVTIEGTFTVGLYTEEDAPGTLLTRDADGMPFYNGDTEVDFTLQIPCSLVASPRPAPVLQFGHGFFGTRSEAEDRYLQELANDAGWVILAVDWTGMSTEDLGGVTLMFAGDPSDFAFVPERTMQGFAEALAATRLVMGDFAADAVVTFDDPITGLPVSVIDPDTRYFMGISMGSIIGGAFLGMSPDFERAVLGVGGTPFSILTNRSSNFVPFFLLLDQKYNDGRDITLLVQLVQMLWDVGETAGWAHEVNRDTPAGLPAKSVLMQIGIGDSQVSTLGGQLMARSFGASLVAPAYRPVFGLDERTAPFAGSALVEWHYTDVPEEPVESVAPSDETNTHGCPRHEAMGQAQIEAFFRTGVVEQFCDGVCEGLREGC
jgi:hypothetical protein